MAKLFLTTFLLLLLPIYCTLFLLLLTASYDFLPNFTVESRHSAAQDTFNCDGNSVFPTWFVQRFLCYRCLADCFFPKQEEINALQLFTLLRV